MPLTDILSRQRELSRNSYRHEILVKGPGLEVGRRKVLKFFEDYQLVRYAEIVLQERKTIESSDPGFEGRLREALDKNRRILHGLTRDLEAENVHTLRDIEELPQGYKSKMLHVITHFLDGFFGIDTYFYNLEEESHWVSPALTESMAAGRSGYWLLTVEGRF